MQTQQPLTEKYILRACKAEKLGGKTEAKEKDDPEFISQYWLVFVRLRLPVLKIKLAKQINHMMRSPADCCCFPPPSFYWHFSPSIPNSPPLTPPTHLPISLLKLQLSRHKGPHGPDQMFQAAHFPTLCLMEYSWATRHRSTAQHRAAQTRDHLFINFITPLRGWLRHNNGFGVQEDPLTFLLLSPSSF